MNNAYIVSSVRTAVGKSPRGTLRNSRPDDLGAAAVKGALDNVPKLEFDQVEDLIFGCSFPEAEQGFNLGRVIALRAGLPHSTAGCTVNRFCSSGLQTIAMATQAIMTGQAEVIVAGGAESMSLIPMGGHYLTPNPVLLSEVPEAYLSMGLTAENVAEEFQISRHDQDVFALQSHLKALAALEKGRFKDEVIPFMVKETTLVEGQSQTTQTRFDVDEGPRADTSLEALAQLKPVFKVEGTVTAGTSSQMSDGAAATVVMSERKLRELALAPLGRMLGYSVVGVPPELMGMGPVEAVPKVLKQVGLSLSDIGLIELNEAFAAQALAVMRKLGLDEGIVNVNGGAIALGHPLGCTGAKLTATLLHEMKRRGIRYGLVTMCVGGGMGAAGVFENLML
ncbi:thiolase family protein (plasmid) [Acaryochloris sp. 'Moss Beach']|uniref:thiolase family protein n=1 Tax=Acaryochloris TaxID=155977 RepID=UPI001BAE91D2|nr:MULTISPECIES: thiolase family protein [Acaryochloris]QUY46100.1 thiolase family protein [Acaryochloris marina S15]UJB72572.1 thiolase family protein [Acaryochloris sp. 'Moss Beach']